MSQDHQPTRTTETEEHYQKRAENLFKLYERETNNPWESNPIVFCEWCKNRWLDQRIATSTFKQYRASLKYVFSLYSQNDAIKYLDTRLCTSLFDARGRATSSLKKKSFPHEDIEKIEADLNDNRKWDYLIKLWLRAGITTGLRPCEWFDAKVVISTDGYSIEEWGGIPTDMKGDWLIVRNAKHTNRRANGDFRAINLCLLTTIERSDIVQLLLLLPKSKDEFDYAYQGCRKRLAAVTNKLWPRKRVRPTLYSTRHQFRANASSSGQTLGEIAALMGHATDETASTHYGRSAVGSGRQVLYPHTGNLSTVRQVYVPKLQKSVFWDRL